MAPAASFVRLGSPSLFLTLCLWILSAPCSRAIVGRSAAASPRDCSLFIRLEKGSSWDYENCIFLTSGGGFTFHWTYDRPSRTLDGCFSANWVGWIGWGIGVRMVGASALVALPADAGEGATSAERGSDSPLSIGGPNSTSGYVVARYYLAAKDPYEIRPNTGDLSIHNGSIQVHVQRGTVRVLFAARLPEEQAAGVHMILAKGPGGDPATGRLRTHDPALTAHTYVRLLGGGAPQWLQSLHGAVNVAAWGILMPVGALVARHMRDLDLGESWLGLHRAIQAFSYCLGALGFCLGLLMWGQSHSGRTRRRGWGGGEEGEFDSSTHRSLAITIFVLASFQVTAVVAHPHRDALLRPWWSFFHHWNGRLILVLAVANIWEGMALLHPAAPAWPYVYGLPLGLLVVTASVLEAFLLWRWLTDDVPQTAFQRWAQAFLPRSSWKYSQVELVSNDAAELMDEAEIVTMASRIRRELQQKHM